MAKATTRVYILAGELGVKSQAIVAKCQAEGLTDVKNHMAVIGPGLAATIREWFSEGELATAVESSERVDLAKVRVRRKKKAQAETETTAVAVAEATAAPVESPPSEVSAPSAEPEAVPAVSAPAADIITMPEPVRAEAAADAPVEAASVVLEEKKIAKEIKPKKKPKPEPIKPAGPMLEKPRPAQLTGPTVIRVEKVERKNRVAASAPRPDARAV